MKYCQFIFKSMLILVALLLLSCKNSPQKTYSYKTDLELTWGFVEFYGSYYQNYDIENNVLTLRLFSEKLGLDQKGSLIGSGEYLILEDIFLSPTDTLLPIGTYTISENRTPKTIFPGKLFKEDKEEFNYGAYIHYIETVTTQNKTIQISSGTMNTTIINDTVYQIVFDFMTADNRSIKGKYQGTLPTLDAMAKRTKKRNSTVGLTIPMEGRQLNNFSKKSF